MLLNSNNSQSNTIFRTFAKGKATFFRLFYKDVLYFFVEQAEQL
jgi:hypothetical protein